MFAAPTVTLTRKPTKLCVAQLQAKQENSDLKSPTKVQLHVFILDLFQK
jgi:hypothetical protein